MIRDELAVGVVETESTTFAQCVHVSHFLDEVGLVVVTLDTGRSAGNGRVSPDTGRERLTNRQQQREDERKDETPHDHGDSKLQSTGPTHLVIKVYVVAQMHTSSFTPQNFIRSYEIRTTSRQKLINYLFMDSYWTLNNHISFTVLLCRLSYSYFYFHFIFYGTALVL